MKDHRTIEELLEIVGPGRLSNPPEVVAAAENELRARTADEETLFLDRLRRAGRSCAWLGGLFIVGGLAFAPIGLTVLSGARPNTSGLPFIFRHFDVFFIGGTVLQAVVGVALLMGGLGVRNRKDWGRRLVLGVIWMGMAYNAVFTVVWVVSLFQLQQFGPVPFPFPLAMAGMGVAVAVFWGYVLWLPIRYFSSSRVRQTCGAR